MKAIRAVRHTVRSADGTMIDYRTSGAGPGLVIVGGALRSGVDYEPLAAALATGFTVQVIDRRGRGDSGPQGPDYTLGKEVEDLAAVQRATGATLAFGHSYGGLVVLETARSLGLFDRIAVYEPGVPTAPVATDWMIDYERCLAAGDPAGAFAAFLRGSEGAPPIVRGLPRWYLRAVLALYLRLPPGRRMVPLLGPNLAEHREVAAYYARRDQLRTVRQPVLIMVGGRTPTAADPRPFDGVAAGLPAATVRTVPGLDHFGPEGRGAPAVGAMIGEFFEPVRTKG
ncbi:alpha/beta fold hydrolase [Microlunatus speluncae]|uniref:alpha/beta fold hydrolase n=1 Tax=Microlunatus speluncae TaxID=2594267 RepID=UPI0012667353|nr:alpha/beta hydrolase [Microlunatus speluncae]